MEGSSLSILRELMALIRRLLSLRDRLHEQDLRSREVCASGPRAGKMAHAYDHEIARRNHVDILQSGSAKRERVARQHKQKKLTATE